MIAVKMPFMKILPDACDTCYFFEVRPHPYKGWSDRCELCGELLDDDAKDGWVFDGNERPKNCPLFEVKDGEQE